MRLLAIGDIHGCATALEVLLAAVNLRTGGTIIGLGDYINKGPETKATLDKLIQLFDRGMLIPLLGNHELKLILAGRQGQPQNRSEVLSIDIPCRPMGREEILGHWHLSLKPTGSLFNSTVVPG